MKAPAKTVGFGAPADYGAHVFKVLVPASRAEPVVIVEEFGYEGGFEGRPLDAATRVVLRRPVWAAIADTARRVFNERLKANGQPAGRWTVGDTLVERRLGRELCVLAWAAETANEAQLPIIAAKWEFLRPEERWWLFMETVAQAGGPNDHHRGWRRALFYALSDGEKPLPRPKGRGGRPRDADQIALPLDALREAGRSAPAEEPGQAVSPEPTPPTPDDPPIGSGK